MTAHFISAQVDDSAYFQDTVIEQSTVDSPAVLPPEKEPAVIDDSAPGIIVTGKRYAKYTPSQRVIEAKEFSGKYQDLQSVLETVSGVTVRAIGGFGHYSEVSIRGSSSNQVQINLDGIPLNGATGTTVDISKIPLSALQKISIFKNTPPIEFFGENAGGVINLSTAPMRDVVSSAIEIGSFGYRQGSVLINKTAADVTHRISVDYAGADNSFPYLNDKGTQYNRDDDTIKSMDNNAFSMFSSQYSNSWAIDTRHKLTSQLTTQMTDEGIFYFPQADSNDGSVGKNGVALTERFEAALDSGTMLSITAKGKVEKGSFQRFRPFYLYTSPTRNVTSQPFAEIEGILEKRISAKLLVRAVVSGKYSSFMFSDLYQPASAVHPAFSRVSGKAGGEAEIKLPPLWSIRVGGLYKYEIDSTNGTFYFGGFQPGGHAVSAGTPAAFSEVSCQPAKDIEIRAAVRYSTRSPGFSEKFGIGSNYVGNAVLRPETRLEYDFGVSINKPWINAAASVFGSSTRDKILYEVNSYHIFVPQNMERVIGRGIESEITTFPFKNVSIFNAVTYMENISHTDIANEDGKDEPLSPRFTDDLGARIEFQKIYLVHQARFASRYYLGLANLDLQPQVFPELGCILGFKPGAKIELLYRLENYLNVQNYDFRDQPSPGRRHYFVFKYKI